MSEHNGGIVVSVNTLSGFPIVDNPQRAIGSRDDSRHGVPLPLADLVAQTPVEAPQRFRNWPDLNTRFLWANDVGIALNLSHRERAVLRHVCWRAGKREDGPPGCWESAANIGSALAYHRNQIGQSLAALVDKGLLTATRRFSNSTIHRPTMAELSTISRCTETVQMDARKPCTNKKDKQEGVERRENKSLMIHSKEYQPAIVDNSACGYFGYPPVLICVNVNSPASKPKVVPCVDADKGEGRLCQGRKMS